MKQQFEFRRRQLVTTILLTALVGGATGPADRAMAQSGGGYNLKWNTVNTGGGVSAGAGYSLVATAGQPDAGRGNGVGYRLSGGFLFGSVTPPLPGDCNFDGAVDAADVSAMVLEVFDGDGQAVGATSGGWYPGSTGCNANLDANVDAGDLSCVARLIFIGPASCGP